MPTPVRRFAFTGALLAATLLSSHGVQAQASTKKVEKTAEKAGAKMEKSSEKAARKMDHTMDKADKKIDKAMGKSMGKSMDHDAMGGHMRTGWKELDGYHEYLEATWHPAQGRNDLAPLRAKAGDMAAAAKLLASSTPPSQCNTPDLRAAAAALSPATTDLAVLAAQKASDTQLKTALTAIHARFEVLEKGCAPEGAKH